MKNIRFAVLLVGSVIALSGCIGQLITPTPQDLPNPADQSSQGTPEGQAVQNGQTSVTGLYDRELALQGFQKGGCASCHIIPGVPGATGVLGPDLSEIGQVAAERIDSKEYTGQAENVDEYMEEALLEPDDYLAPDCGGNPCQKGLMPPSLSEALSETELDAVMAYLAALPDYEQSAGGEEVSPARPAR